MTSSDPVVIVGAARTPMGGLQGDFAALSAPAARLGRDRRGGGARGAAQGRTSKRS